ncbi:DUF5103 domain-containing protein [Christiangramia aquimixticola]|uniref:type IX secretion system plug protein n=1 Tax=Christiangramia aquimixticola TaxID=1697558 RepID=UPI003AA9CF98
MKAFSVFILFVLIGANLFAQIEETAPPPFIRTVILKGNAMESGGTPMVPLGASIQLSFDDIIGDEADYYYTLEHFNFDWTPTELNKTEYLEGFDNVRISDHYNALNTLQPFTHYELSIPNKNVKHLKVSGNYLLSIFNVNRELVFSRKFMVYEPIVQVAAEVKRSRDLNYIDEKQVVNFSINSPELILKNPDHNLKVALIQNSNLNTAITNLKPQYSIANELIYRYDKESAFWGGNEFLQFDNKDIRVTTADISSVELGDHYHHFLYIDLTRANQPYSYNPDINGKFVIRNFLAENSNREADYVWIHFRLKNYDDLKGQQVHIYGAFNNFTIDASTKLTYNEGTGLYEGARLFKQGYYNYKYVLVDENGAIDEGFISGNFDETENDYQILVYYSPPGARYDRIIGIGHASSRNIRN